MLNIVLEGRKITWSTIFILKGYLPQISCEIGHIMEDCIMASTKQKREDKGIQLAKNTPCRKDFSMTPSHETSIPPPGQKEESTVISSLSVEEKDNLHRSTKKIKTGTAKISERNQDPEVSNIELQDEG